MSENSADHVGERIHTTAVEPERPKRIGAGAVAMIAAAAVLVGGGTGAGITAIAVSTHSDSASSTSEQSAADDTATTESTPSEGTLPEGTLPERDYGFGFPDDGTTADAASDTTATDAESAGVVLVETELDFGTGAGAGTGIVLTSDGRILTNHHVIEGATTITVTIATTGEQYEAEVVGSDTENDIAVLQLDDAAGLDTAAIDDSGEVSLGDEITGVGNANGQGYLSAVDGTVTGLDREITVAGTTTGTSEDLDGLIEVDAAIVSGDSGGPLLDADGEVIGIDTAASSDTRNPTGYAIPIDDALAIVEQIDSAVETGVTSGSIEVGYPAFLGVAIAETTADAGVTISGTFADTPAAEAGLVAGDTITSLDGVTIASYEELAAVIAGYAPGDDVTIGWTDAAGGSNTATVTLVEGPAD